MDLKRFFIDEKITGNKVVLEGDEFYHAVKVTRHKVGFKIIICDNGDTDYYCKITEINKENLVAEVEKEEKNTSETSRPVSLYIGINKDIDTVVQKAVELGISKIVPFTSRHGNIDTVNYDRLNKIILESSKQCGRSRLARLEKVVPFSIAIEYAKNDNLLLFYEFETHNKVSDVVFNHEKSTSVFIGSEGGFSTEEIEYARQHNAGVLTLGKRILRVSTAVVSALTLCLSRLGEM